MEISFECSESVQIANDETFHTKYDTRFKKKKPITFQPFSNEICPAETKITAAANDFAGVLLWFLILNFFYETIKFEYALQSEQ